MRKRDIESFLAEGKVRALALAPALKRAMWRVPMRAVCRERTAFAIA